MEITFTDDIRTDFDGYQCLLRVLEEGLNSSDDTIIFDFRNVRFLEANLCAVIAAIIEILEQHGKTVTLCKFQNQVETILRKNEFLLPYNYGTIVDRYQTAIPYRKFDPSNQIDDNNFEEYIRTELLSKNDFPSISDLLGKHITLRIFELYENARTHGHCSYIHACGQYFPQKLEKPLNITIVDRGKNFQENVSEYVGKSIDALFAIEWAMQKGNTTKTGNISGGLGLDLIFQFVQHNKGKIQVISSNGFWEWHRGSIKKLFLPHSFNGTIANLRFNLNDTSYYSLAEEQATDFDNLF